MNLPQRPQAPYNRTGTLSSDNRIAEMCDIEDLAPQDQPAPGPWADEIREMAMQEADPVGSRQDRPDAPPPHKLLDLLGGRMAFERGGVRLYDALLRKAQLLAIRQRAFNAVERLQQIREQEAEHALLLQQIMIDHGGDPTMETPCADLEGVMSTGLLKVVHDPRTTLAQCLQAALVAELADVESWTALIRVANEVVGEQDIAQLARALATEQEHLETIRDLVRAVEQVELQAPELAIAPRR